MKNIIRGIITTLVSVAIFSIVSYYIYLGKVKFIGEGGVGYLIGTILLFSSDSIIKDIKDVIIAIFKKDKCKE